MVGEAGQGQKLIGVVCFCRVPLHEAAGVAGECV